MVNIPCAQMAKPKLVLQSDWNDVLRKKEKCWVSCLRPDASSIHSYLHCDGVSATGELYLSGADGFMVGQVTKSSVQVSYTLPDNGDICQTTFVDPQQVFQHRGTNPVRYLDVTGGGLGVSSHGEKMLLWDTASGTVRRELAGHVGEVYGCKFFPSGVVILSWGADMQIKVWSATDGSCPRTLTGHHRAVSDMQMLGRGRSIVSVSVDGSCRLWDCGQGSCVSVVCELRGALNTLAVQATGGEGDDSDTGDTLGVLGSETGLLVGVNIRAREKVFEKQVADDAINSIEFLSDNNFICGTQKGRVLVYDLRNLGTPTYECQERGGPILSLLPYRHGAMVSTADGSCYHLPLPGETRGHFTPAMLGPDCDAVYKVSADAHHIYTCCRDGSIRKYSVNDLWS